MLGCRIGAPEDLRRIGSAKSDRPRAFREVKLTQVQGDSQLYDTALTIRFFLIDRSAACPIARSKADAISALRTRPGAQPGGARLRRRIVPWGNRRRYISVP